MSTHWDLYCETCKEHDRYTIWLNHGERDIRALAGALPHLVGVADALDAFYRALGERAYRFEIQFDIAGSHHPTLGELAAWARKHAGHVIKPMNEYGQTDDQCNKRFRCSAGHEHDCEFTLNHEGEHGPKVPT